MRVAIVVDDNTAMVAVDDWTATVTQYRTAGGPIAYRVSQSHGGETTSTNHDTLVSALITLLELTTTVLTMEGTEPCFPSTS